MLTLPSKNCILWVGAVVMAAALLLPDVATAQIPVVIDFGVRGGGFFTEPPIVANSNHYFPPSYTSERSPVSVGPSVAALLFDRVEVRFEAVHKNFKFQSHSNVPPLAGSSYTSTAHGHSWAYPLLGTYRFGH